jgi:hypothetical protein
MTDRDADVNAAFDHARKSEREVRDDSIDDELDQTDRIAEKLGRKDEPVE